jgi:hypothetical protein
MNSYLALVELRTQQHTSVLLPSEKYYRFHMGSSYSSYGAEKKAELCRESNTGPLVSTCCHRFASSKLRSMFCASSDFTLIRRTC